jgi:hypothetical protein
MSVKTEAIAQTAKEFALAAIAGSATIYVLTNIPESIIQYIPHIGISVVLAGMVYLMYSINLGRIQYRKHLEDMEKAMEKVNK